MSWLAYGFLAFVAAAISATAVWALYWASKHGQLRDFDAQARSIFDETEPEGVPTDFFPGKAPGAAGPRPSRSP
jgi:nitrogen fixation-related uncharacterized protein